MVKLPRSSVIAALRIGGTESMQSEHDLVPAEMAGSRPSGSLGMKTMTLGRGFLPAGSKTVPLNVDSQADVA
jgi:hypothetical protein